ncbi:uncharacterized protein JCM6883_002626 [Sporobolomyces salmoneus]|uniref:uncharacterized protein n=1 Tax=Sporobolomyces salmoneus TaxID=183962 RepID=UPI0031795662
MMNYTATPPVVPMNCASNPTMASLSTFSPPPPLPYFDRSSLPLPPSLSTSHSFSVRIPRGSINTPVLPSSTGPPTSSFPALPSHPLPAPSYPPLPPLPLPLPSASSTYSSSRPQLESAVPLGYLDPPPSDRNDTAVDLHPSRRSTRKRTRTIENEKEEVELEEEEGEDELVKKKRAVRSGKGKGKGKGAGGRKNSAKRSTSQQEGTSEKPKSTKKFKTDRNADNADGHVQEGDEEDEDVDEDDGYEMSEGRKMEEEARVRKLRDEGSVRERWVKYAAAILVAKEGGGDPAEARNYLGSLIERIGSSSTLPLDQKQYRSSTFLANLKRLDDCATENLDQGRVGEWKNSSPDAWKDGKPVTNSLPKSMEECDRMSLGNWPPCENPSTCATMEDWVKTKTIQDNAVQLDLLPHMFSVSYTGLPVTEMFYSETGRRLLQERAGAILGYAVENGILLELYGSDVKQMILNSDGFEFTTVELEVEWEGEKPGEEKTCIVETVMARKRGGNEGEGTIVVVLAHPCRGSAGYANVISLRNQPETLEPNPDRHYNEKAYGGNAAPGGRSMMNGITVNKKAGEEFQRGTPLEPFEWGIRLGRLIPTYKNDVSTWSKASAFVKNDPILPNALRNSEVQIAARAIQLRSQETRELRSVPEEERTVEQRIRLETRDRINHERHHSEKEALRTGKYRCTFPGCDIKFKGSEQLKVHRYSHTGAYPYKCDQCVPARGFGYLSEFQAHQSTHTGKWRHQCQELGCDRGFHQFHELEAHQSTHTGKWRHQCQELGCDRGFHQFHELEGEFSNLLRLSLVL